MKKQNNQLRAAMLLLQNVLFNPVKYTRADLKEKLNENGLSSSDSSITRLLYFISDIFGIELSFRTYNKRVAIMESFDNNYSLMQSLLLLGSLQSEKHLLENNIISFTSQTVFNNIDLVPKFLLAIAQSKLVKIIYRKYTHRDSKTEILKPILIKEYLGRWYIIAEKKDLHIRVYGLDRIVEFEILSKTFSRENTNVDLYKQTIGVNYSGEVENIILEVEEYQLQLFENYPLHPSQKIYDRSDDKGKLSLEVVVNYELKQLLASFLYKVKVIEPKQLRDDMANIYAEMKKNHNN